MTNRPCIIILNWNTSHFIAECIGGISALNDATLILVDNHSEAGQFAELNQLARDHGATIIENPTNLGYAGGMNTGMRAAINAGHEHAILLNPDTYPTVHHIDALWSHRHQSDLIGIAQAQAAHGAAEVVHPYDTAGRMAGPKIYPIELGEGSKLRDVDVVSGACLLVNLRSAASVNLMDERYFHYFEEVDFCYRLRRSGYRVSHLSDPVLLHHRGGALDGASPGAAYYMTRNQLLFARWNFGWWSILRLKRLLVTVLFEIVRHPRDEASVARIQAVWHGLRGIFGPRNGSS